MAEINDTAISQMLIKNGLIKIEALQKCLQAQKILHAQGNKKSLDTILLEQHQVKFEDIVYIKNCIILEKEIDTPGLLFLEKLGEGGMGAVYKGMQLSLNRPVAIKLLNPDLGKQKDFIERFRQEARVLAQLTHSNIVRGIDFGESHGTYYYVMELLEGSNIEAIVNKLGPYDEKATLPILLQMAHALDYIQQKNLVHRDIKPENILVCEDGTAKLCDLGLAKWKRKSSNLTQEGSIVGTPYYTSPEQCQGVVDVDIRSDIYSLGATAHFMLTGKPPYEGEQASVIFFRHIYDPAPKITTLRPDLPSWWDALFARIMAKKLDDRFQTPKELVEWLEDYKYGMQSNTSSPAKPVLVADNTPILQPVADTKKTPPVPSPINDESAAKASTKDVYSKGPSAHTAKRTPTSATASPQAASKKAQTPPPAGKSVGEEETVKMVDKAPHKKEKQTTPKSHTPAKASQDAAAPNAPTAPDRTGEKKTHKVRGEHNEVAKKMAKSPAKSSPDEEAAGPKHRSGKKTASKSKEQKMALLVSVLAVAFILGAVLFLAIHR